jgi:hypothetical protein
VTWGLHVLDLAKGIFGTCPGPRTKNSQIYPPGPSLSFSLEIPYPSLYGNEGMFCSPQIGPDRVESSRLGSGRVGSDRNVSPGAGAPLPSPTVPSAAAPPGSGSDGEDRRRREAREEEDTAIESERQRIPQPLRVKEKGVSIDKEVWKRRNQKGVVGIKRRVVECCDLTQAVLSSCKRFWTSCVQQAGVVFVESSSLLFLSLLLCVSLLRAVPRC